MGMSTLTKGFQAFAGALALLCVLILAVPASAQVRNPDGSVNPTASSVQESQLLQELQKIQGRVSIPDKKEGVLIQPAGQNWRHFHEVTLRWIGGIAILGMLILLIAFYLIRGMVRLKSGRSGRMIVRFSAFERFVHWMTATCFVILAITGLNITFGRPLLLPLMSPEAFTAWSEAAKYAHNFVSFPFTIGVVLIFLMWIAGNIPNRVDVEWVKAGGGIVGDGHPPSYRFNAGQKMIYWIVVLGGAASAISGYLLMFPFYGDLTVSGMQTAQMVHSIVAVLFVAAMLAHIYIGTIGMEGAFEAMGTGEVDVNWAREHHNLWLDEELKRNRDAAPSGARATPAE
jgi:formate dehydrogenase subunit gamma